MNKKSLTVVAAGLSAMFAAQSANAGIVDTIKGWFGLNKPAPMERPAPLAAPAPIEEEVPAEPTAEAAPDLIKGEKPVEVAAKTVDAKQTPSKDVPTNKANEIFRNVGVNPFTGKALTYEERAKRLELMKLDSSTIEEEIRQEGLKYDLAQLPVERENRIALLRNAGQMANSSATNSRPSVTAAAPAKKTVKRTKPIGEPNLAAAGPSIVVPPAPPAPPEPKIEVSSILSKAGVPVSAIIMYEGKLLSVKDGQDTEFGKIKIISSDKVQVGSRTASLKTGVNRVFITDADPANRPQMTSAATMPSAAPSAPVNAATTPTNFVPTLPPLPTR